MVGKRRGRKRKAVPVTVSPLVIMVEVENPYFSGAHFEDATNPRKITAAMSMRESPAIWMHQHKQLDDAQAACASRFRRHFEAAGGSGAKAMDTTKEPVDGGKVEDGITDSKVDAAKQLFRARAVLDVYEYRIVEQVCGQCIWIKDLVASKRAQLVMAQDLRVALDKLAMLWGYARRAA